jgi:hypothetical protein
MKIYKKRGNKNYKERKLLKDLEPFFKKKMEEDPTFADKVVPATNFSELQKMHSRYVAVDVEATYIDNPKEEIKEEIKEEKMAKTEDVEDVEFTETKEPNESKNTEGSSSNQFIDPFNREEPIVRDYVMDGGFKDESKQSNEPQKTYFEEPTSFEEAFVIPEDDGESGEPKANTEKSKSTDSSKSTESLNPNFDDMSAGKKKRSTKKFAKYIVEAVATLSQKGFVWYANQDINEAKLTEYEMSGEMDLSLLVSLEDGQEVTVKQFFQVQCAKAEQMSHWTEEQKADLSAALAEVLMEKGVAPTPTQELLLVTLTIIGGQAMTLFTLKSQTNSLLNQLRSMNEGGMERETTFEEPPSAPTPPVENVTEPITDSRVEEPIEESIEDLTTATEETEQSFVNELASLTEEDVLISDGKIDTKE